MKLRLQLLPDGRCGIALNGRPFFLSQRPVNRIDAIRILLSGSSVGTQALVGPIVLQRGVPGDVDWTAFDLQNAARIAADSAATR
jgi:hypothetical protein